jgi:hypothetical protein
MQRRFVLLGFLVCSTSACLTFSREGATCVDSTECGVGSACVAGVCHADAAADAGGTDAGPPDAGAQDAGATDAGGQDAGGMDAGLADAGGQDARVLDAGAADAGGDAGLPDAGADAGLDAGPLICPGAVVMGLSLSASSGVTASQLLIDDLDQDGYADLLLSTVGTGNMTVMLGQGDGGFWRHEFNIGGQAPVNSVAIVPSFDGGPRLLAAYSQGEVHLFAYVPSQQLWSRTLSLPLPGPVIAGQLAAGDFNGDQRSDLVAYNWQGDGVLWLQQADGGFDPDAGRLLQTESGNYRMLAADVNGDHHQDLVLACAYGTQHDAVEVLLGDGTGALTPSSTPYLALNGATGLSSGTFAGGSTPWFVVPNQQDLVGTDFVVLAPELRADGGVGFISTGSYSAAVPGGTVTATGVGDVTGDGLTDVVASSVNGNLILYRGVRDGGLENAGAYGYVTDVRQFAVGDLNGDGQPDVVATNLTSTVQLRLSTGPHCPVFLPDGG